MALPHPFDGIPGEAAALARALDWGKTSLGPVSEWPVSLRTAAGIVLRSRHPMFLWWGPDLVQLYNDAYAPSFGRGRHPAAMGQNGRDCWQDIWPVIWPQIDDAMSRGIASWNVDQLLPIFRNGRFEEVYWTYSYSGVPGDNGAIGGTLVTCTETTSRVLSDRRQRTLRLLAEQTVLAATAEELLTTARLALDEGKNDFPFVLFDREIKAAGVAVPVPAELAKPGAVWPEQVQQMFVSPLPLGTVAFGLSPRLPFDEAYREYCLQVVQLLQAVQIRIASRNLAEEERNSLLQQAPVATALTLGPGHVFALANPRYLEIVGKNRPVVGKRYVDAFPELLDSPLPKILDHVYETGQPFVTNEMLVPLDRVGSGVLEDCYYKFNLEPLRGLDGRIYGMMAVAVDITEQVRIRRNLEKANEEREKLLVEVEAASRTKDEFLAMLGHELRNPLSPIVTALELMKLRAHGAVPREQEVIERQVRHLVRMVDDLLDVSRITGGKVELRRETVELADVLTKSVELASVLLEQRSHELFVSVPQGIGWEGDPVRLAQVVSNLLTNAARYTPIGGLIQLTAVPEADDVVITVKDNGSGIDPHVLPRIFDLFYQGKRSSDRTEGGLGIGLALVKNLVAMHGGTVVARSDGPGKGSEFEIRLPLSAAVSTSPVRADAGTSPAASRPRRVLVVDDNEDAAELLADMLRGVGHTVIVANDPLAALAKAEAFAPDVAVLDIGLPVMDGYELALKLRERPALADLRMIALTGYGQDHDRARSRASGFVEHLVKPVDLPRLLKLVVADP